MSGSKYHFILMSEVAAMLVITLSRVSCKNILHNAFILTQAREYFGMRAHILPAIYFRCCFRQHFDDLLLMIIFARCHDYFSQRRAFL